jgi:hypothetical protein
VKGGWRCGRAAAGAGGEEVVVLRVMVVVRVWLRVLPVEVGVRMHTTATLKSR